MVSVLFDYGLEYIGANAFSYCTSLLSVSIPESVEVIDEDVWGDCSNMIDINVSPQNDNYYSINGVLYNKKKDTLIQYPNGRQEPYIVPDGVKIIQKFGFTGCKELTTITLPKSIVRVDEFSIDNTIRKIRVPYGQKERFAQMKGLQEYSDFIVEEESVSLPKEIETPKQEIEEKVRCEETLEPYYLFFDTETAGVPSIRNASVTFLENWPRVVQLAWILSDCKGNIIKKRVAIISPNGFKIPEEAVRIHGITTERAIREGLPLYEVLEDFMKDLESVKMIIAHNIDFDQKILGAELLRMGFPYYKLIEMPAICTMKSTTKFCAILNPNARYGGYKWPSLQELYRKLFNRDFTDAHDALADITATKECFFELKRKGVI